jgi:DNA-binding CsgD family transcriptional regulator
MGQKIDKNTKLTLAFLGFTSFILFTDIIDDINSGVPTSHWLHELLIVVFCFSWLLFQLFIYNRQSKVTKKIKEDSVDLLIENRQYQIRLDLFKADFSEIVMEAFDKWRLTKSEKDIATLIIKGMTMKEIGSLRGSKESTIRQQAKSIYEKSKLVNRNQLSAYFLDF